ncbi:MAG: 4Fe-4S binding protein [Candidatus Cloacimonadota bacterium]|nr:4Fe-4S binding protein [Candidatus Cloacimonadota bacterium]
MKKYKIIREKCDACACCEAVCPADAIRITEESAYIIREECIGCGKCLIACPVSAVVEERSMDEN